MAKVGQRRADPFAAGAGGAPAVVFPGAADLLGPVVSFFQKDTAAGKVGVATGRTLAPDRSTAAFAVRAGMGAIPDVRTHFINRACRRIQGLYSGGLRLSWGLLPWVHPQSPWCRPTPASRGAEENGRTGGEGALRTGREVDPVRGRGVC